MYGEGREREGMSALSTTAKKAYVRIIQGLMFLLLINSGNFQGVSLRCFPYTTACQLTKPVVGYAVRDTAFELGLPSSTRKLIPLLLDVDHTACIQKVIQH